MVIDLIFSLIVWESVQSAQNACLEFYNHSKLKISFSSTSHKVSISPDCIVPDILKLRYFCAESLCGISVFFCIENHYIASIMLLYISNCPVVRTITNIFYIIPYLIANHNKTVPAYKSWTVFCI